MVRGRDAALRTWVEEFALAFERDGLPRMAGRIFGWLLVCDPPEQTMEQLAAALSGSKASMSTMTRVLVQAGLVERSRQPGARRDHFRVRPGQWDRLFRSRLDAMNHVLRLVERGQELVGRAPATHRTRLDELHDLYSFFSRELPPLLERWSRERARPAPRPARRKAGARA